METSLKFQSPRTGEGFMQWEVSGADRATGIDRTLTIEADDEASALRRANRRGILASTVTCLDVEDSVVNLPAVLGGNDPFEVIDDTAPAVRAGQVVEYVHPVHQHPVYQQQHYAPPVIRVNNTVVVHNHNHGAGHSRALAAILSLIIPGLGQAYKGQLINGIVWFFVVGAGYVCLVIPGVVLHLCCILGAASGK